MHTTSVICVLLAAAMAGPIAQEKGESAGEIVSRANDLVSKGAFADALKEYERAAELKPDAPEVSYNKGVALYRMGDYKNAAEAFGGAMDASRPWLDRRARYNAGNCAFAEALAAMDQNPQAAIERLGEALNQYRDVLASDPRDAAARANLERSHLLKEELEKLLQQQQQQQNQQGDDENQDESKESSDQPDSQKNDEQKDRQEQQQNESNKQDQQSSQEGEQKQSDQEAKQGESQESQESQQGQQQNEKQQSESGKQEPKEGELKEAQAQEQKADQAGEQQAKPTDEQGEDGKPMPGRQVKMSPEEAKRLLQMIRDKEQQRRAAVLRAQQQKQEPVTRDW